MPLPLTVSCSSKSRLVLPFLVLPFWYLLTRVVPDKFQKSSKTVVCVYVVWQEFYKFVSNVSGIAEFNITQSWLADTLFCEVSLTLLLVTLSLVCRSVSGPVLHSTDPTEHCSITLNGLCDIMKFLTYPVMWLHKSTIFFITCNTKNLINWVAVGCLWFNKQKTCQDG